MEASVWERLAQVAHVHGQRVVVHELVRLPQLLLDALAAHDLSGIAHQKRKDPELVLRELHTAPLVLGHATVAVQAHAAALQHRGASGAAVRALKQPRYARKQHGSVVRLRHEVVRAKAHAQELVRLPVAARHHDDGHVGLAAHLAAHVLAVHAWQVQVQKHQVRAGGKHLPHHVVKRLDGMRLVAVVPQERQQLLPQLGVVLDHKQVVVRLQDQAPPPTASPTGRISVPSWGVSNLCTVDGRKAGRA